MNKLQKDEQGFSAVEFIMVFVIIILIGAVGYFVYKSHHQPAKVITVTKTITTTPKTSTSVNPYASWTSYTSASGKFSLKYPQTWVTAKNQSSCPSGIFLLGANSSSVGVCGSNNFGQITITWQPVRTSCGLDNSVWTTNSTEAVTVSGVSGTETSGTAKNGNSVPVGTTSEQYCFITNGTIYIANYTQLSTYPDALADFNLMVTKTLTFN